MPWNELHLKTSAEHAEAISQRLHDEGAVAVTFQDGADQPIFEPKQETPRIWPTTVVVGLFEETIDIKHLLQTFTDFSPRIIHIPDEDWVRRSLDSFQPMLFGKKLWVCPSWQTPPDPEGIIITLDPGLAFGTGSHPTTALCLSWLSEHLEPGQTVIDYGCGSGILGIAALKLGAKKVIAVDNDPQALLSAETNRIENGIEPQVFTTYLPKNMPDEKADLVIANILAQPLLELAPKIASFNNFGGKILLSGILSAQVESINNAYKHWYDMQHPVYKGEWVSLEGIRSNNI